MARWKRVLARTVGAVVAVWLGAASAFAACPDAIASLGPVIRTMAMPGAMPVALRVAQVPPGKIRITFAGHASFFVETPEGVGIFTDFNGIVPPPRLPDIVTMNRSHATHYTDVIPPGITHVLRGWNPAGGMAVHNVRMKDTVVRNVPTNIGEFGNLQRNENSIFIIETHRMCLAHLSHLHHVLSPEQLQAIGEIDIAFLPIDGFSTMSHDEAMHVMGQIKPRLIIPMHYHMRGAADAFVARAREVYPIRRRDSATITIGREDLPGKAEVLFLRPGH